jgi:hypothetical protein
MRVSFFITSAVLDDWSYCGGTGVTIPYSGWSTAIDGRYCNASKLAGEVDLFEALDAVKRQYQIDENRIVIRGFSMGGLRRYNAPE